MKISCSTYNFRPLMENHGGTMTIAEMVATIKEMGFDGVEAEQCTFVDKDLMSSAKLLKDECDKHGLPIVCFSVGADLLLKAEESKATIKQQILAAKIMGAPRLRHDICWGIDQPVYRSFAYNCKKIAAQCRELTEFGAEHGIETMSENHGYYFQDSRDVEMLINEVDHPNYGLLYDIGNVICADEDFAHACGVLKHYAKMAHVKDFYVANGNAPFSTPGFFPTRGGNLCIGTIVGNGVVPVHQLLRELKDRVEWVTVEYEGPEGVMKGVLDSLVNTRRIINQI